MNELDSLLILNAVPGLSNAQIRKLVKHFGSAGHVLSLSETDFEVSQLAGFKAIGNILSFSKDSFLESEHELIRRNKVKIITIQDENYPQQLKMIPDAPVVLYMKGELPEDQPLAVSIVGSRKASIYGTTMAEQFSTRLSELGMTIVSGLARGIDTAAHKGALKANGATIAVLGSGLAHIYPTENRFLADQVVDHGAIISEFSMTTPPFAYNFPRRNRVVSGMSLGVIVIEAAKRSGALITANFALEQGREVFAVPGKIDSPTSGGVNNLIKQGAKLVTCVEDVLEELKTPLVDYINKQEPEIKVTQEREPKELTQEEQRIYRYTSERPIHIDELIENSGSYGSAIGSILLQLELKKLVKQLPGKLFVRKR